jgi:hypothetical protein
MKISIILEKSEIKEYLYSGLSNQLENFSSIDIDDISQDKYGSFYLFLSGDAEDLREYLLFLGYPYEKIKGDLTKISYAGINPPD